MMTFHLPQVIWASLMAISFSVNATNQGKQKTGTYGVQFWAIGFGIEAGLLYWGGFFS